MYCDYLFRCVSCTVIVLTCFVMCGCVYVCVHFVKCRCFGNSVYLYLLCFCIVCILFLYCFIYVYSILTVLSVQGC